MNERELDAQVAEKVMGHEVRTVSEDEHGVICVYHREWAYTGDKYIYWEREGYQPEVYLPHYSTDIRAAMEVVEKMRKRYSNIGMSGANGWHVSLYDVNGEGECRNYVGADDLQSLPRAICLAALLAVAERCQ